MTEKVSFQKVVADGQAMGYWHDKALFVPGPVADEVVEVRVTNEKTKSAVGVVERYVDPVAYRGQPHEAHYGACSPWQALDYGRQIELKTAMLAEAFARPGLELAVHEMVAAEQQFGYRNKLEFVFEVRGGELKLALHDRGSATATITAPDGCVLGSERMNAAAIRIAELLGQLDLQSEAKRLMVRESQTGNGMIAIIELSDDVKRNWSALKLPALSGVAVVLRGRRKQPEILWSEGSLAIGETILGVQQYYPWDSFFQVNVPVFERALERIVGAVPDDKRVVDLYGGAGSIGLALAASSRSVVSVDIVRASVEVARRNGRKNGFTNYRAIIAAGERLDPAVVRSADVVVVDPPRAGLHAKVVDLLLTCAPKMIVYLSCNPITQVRDLMVLKNAGYHIGQPTGFDFYPGTLHLESLVVLTKK